MQLRRARLGVLVSRLASVLHAASAQGRAYACVFSTLRLTGGIACNGSVQKKDGMTPHAFHILESRRPKPPQTMKLVLALAGTAAAFVAPVREQRLVQAVSPLTP